MTAINAGIEDNIKEKRKFTKYLMGLIRNTS
jgi:hypothetical protein